MEVWSGSTASPNARTIYAWKAKHGGMEVSEVQEVKQLREKNARLIADSGSEQLTNLIRQSRRCAPPPLGSGPTADCFLATAVFDLHQPGFCLRRPRLCAGAAS